MTCQKDSPRNSFASQVTRKALTESGAKQVLSLDLDVVGPTMNSLRNNHWRKNQNIKEDMHQAIDAALQS